MKRILVLCTGNSARSQMGEGLFRHEGRGAYEVESAGTRPSRVRPEAIVVMQEIGIDISSHRSKDVAEIPADDVDLVVTLCAEEECPLFLGTARRLHWGLPDPAAVHGSEETRLAAYRATRDELRRRIDALLTSAEPRG